MSAALTKLIQAVDGLHRYLQGKDHHNAVLDKVEGLICSAKGEVNKKPEPAAKTRSSGGIARADSQDEKMATEKMLAFLSHGKNPAGLDAWQEGFVESVGAGFLKYGCLTIKQFEKLLEIWNDLTDLPVPGKEDDPVTGIVDDDEEIPF